MKQILNYNFKESDIQDLNFEALYNQRRRDSIFAFVWETENKIYALRDHIGMCPLWYMWVDGDLLFSTNLEDLPHGKEFSDVGLRSYISIGTTKLAPLFTGVEAVLPGTVLCFDLASGTTEVVHQHTLEVSNGKDFLRSHDSVVATVDKLLKQAVKRQVGDRKTAGLYLSGGIDSALIGIYLKELGIETTTFTNLKDLKGASEQKCLEINLQLIKPAKSYIETTEGSYESLIPSIIKHCKQPIGNLSILAVANLWDKCPLEKSELLFFGQNSDVINNATDNRFVTEFAFLVPRFLRRLLGMTATQLIDRHMLKFTNGDLDHDPLCIGKRYSSSKLSSFQLVSLTGMYIRRTFIDGEVLAQPAINNAVPVGNPYYDIDVIEYLMSLSVRHKLAFKPEATFPISLEKRIFQSLAIQKGLPPEVAYRKKGFTVSRENTKKNFFDELPNTGYGFDLQDEERKLAAHVLKQYMSTREN